VTADTPATDLPSTSAWSSPSFRRLWAGSTLSAVGAEVGELAIPLFALGSLSASAAELSALRVAQFVPFLLATLPLGILVDHARRRPLMIIADLGRFAALVLIPVSFWLGLTDIAVVCALLLAVGTLTVLHQSADFAMLPTLLSPAQLADANGKLSASYSTAEIGGRGAGGLLVQALTAPVALLATAAGYLASAFVLTGIRLPEPTPARRSGRLGDLPAGFRIATGNAVLRGFLGGATTFNLFYEVYLLSVTLYLVKQIAVAPAVLGAVLVIGGVGSLLGSWFGPKLSRRHHYGRVLLSTLAIGNTAPLLVALTPLTPGHEVPVVMAAFVVMGIGIGISNAHVVTVRQLVAPPGALGRLNSAYRMVSWGAIPIGATIGGVAATRLGPWGAMVLGAAGLAAATIWVVLSPVRKIQSAQDASRFAGQPNVTIRG
jgi:predicted MFS family arabinose efflux permease